MFVEYLAPGPAHEVVAPLFEEMDIELWIPDICLLEVTNALRKRFLIDKRFTRRHLADGIADLLALGPLVVSSTVLVERTVKFATNLTAYDAAYVALAAARRIPVCTLDTGLATQARKAGVTAVVPGKDSLSI